MGYTDISQVPVSRSLPNLLITELG
jgi:hypothetical protein